MRLATVIKWLIHARPRPQWALVYTILTAPQKLTKMQFDTIYGT